MLTRYRDPARAPAPTTRPTRGLVRTALLTAIVFSLAACSGGSGATPKASPLGTVVIKVTDSAGTPISGASVAINEPLVPPYYPNTDSNGALTLQEGAGEYSVGAVYKGFRPARREFTVRAGSVTTVDLALEKVTKATPVVLATRSTASSDGKTLSVDVDMAVLDEYGAPWETLTAAEFSAHGLGLGYCEAYGFCLYDSDNRPVGYVAQVDPRKFSLVPARSQPATAIAVLLDQSAEMAKFDPTRQRLKAVNAFFHGVTPPDVVMLGTYQGVTGKPVIQTYGGFTSDAASLADSVDALGGLEQGSNAVHSAILAMISFVGANPPAGSSELQRTVVAVTSGEPGLWYNPASFSAVETSDVPVVTIGPYRSLVMVGRVTARSGGALVFADYPEQLAGVFRSLGAIVGRSLAFNRVHMVLDAGKPGVFMPGKIVDVVVSVRVGPQTAIECPVAVRI